jgi:hypothetical protein
VNKKLLLLSLLVVGVIVFSVFGYADVKDKSAKDVKVIDKYVGDLKRIGVDDGKGVKDKEKINVKNSEEKCVTKKDEKDKCVNSGVFYTTITDDNIDVTADAKKKKDIVMISAFN